MWGTQIVIFVGQRCEPISVSQTKKKKKIAPQITFYTALPLLYKYSNIMLKQQAPESCELLSIWLA